MFLQLLTGTHAHTSTSPAAHVYIWTLPQIFFPRCSHILLLSPKSGWTQLLPSEEAQRKSLQAANCPAGLCICLAEGRADDVTEQMCVCPCVCGWVCVRACVCVRGWLKFSALLHNINLVCRSNITENNTEGIMNPIFISSRVIGGTFL